MVSREEVVSLGAGYLLPSPFNLNRTRWQMEPFCIVRCISKVQVTGLAAIWVLSRTWYSPFQGDSRTFFVLNDSKSEEWEKIGHVH